MNEVQREFASNYGLKWDEFRERRAVKVDKYVKARKLQTSCEILVKQQFMRACIAKLFGNYEKLKAIRYKEYQRNFAIFMVSIKFKVRTKKRFRNFYHK